VALDRFLVIAEAQVDDCLKGVLTSLDGSGAATATVTTADPAGAETAPKACVLLLIAGISQWSQNQVRVTVVHNRDDFFPGQEL